MSWCVQSTCVNNVHLFTPTVHHIIPARVFSWLKLTELKSTKIVSPSAHPMLSYFTWVLPQLPRPVHEEPLQPHSAQAVAHFGRLAEQSPLTGYEPKGLMTAGSDTASTTSGRSSTCSMTTQGDHSTTPSAGQKRRAATSAWIRRC